MYKKFFNLKKAVAIAICLAGIAMTSGCDPEENENNYVPKFMTMTTANAEVRFELAGTGTVTFDWGDGSPKEEVTLSDSVNEYGYYDRYEFSHNYSSEMLRTITITGDHIEDFYCHYIKLKTLDVSNNPALIYLSISNHQLTELNLNGLTNLEYLYCIYNQLTSIDVSSLINLSYLACNNNQLTSLNLQGLTKLKTLSCYDNQLTSLNLGGLANLEVLLCGYNQLISLNVSEQKKMQRLDCQRNMLTSLDLSGLTELKDLWCGYNQLTSLDVSGLTNLGYLECQNNYMNATALNALFTSLPTLEFGSTVWITNNGPNYDGTGSRDCDKTIAESKGWNVGL